MPNKDRNIPKRRFKEFENADAWELRKLGEVGTVAMCRRIFKEQTSEHGEIPFYKIGTFGGTPDAFIARELFEEFKDKYSYPNIGDILISASGSIGRTVEFLGEDEYFQDSNIVWLKHDGKINNIFLKQFYSIVKWSGIEGSTIKRLYNENILNTEISLPTLPEQKAIGSFFSTLDRQITLHQRKLDKLKCVKQAYLSEMFPAEGERVPKRRFPGFTDAWELRKLGELGTLKNGMNFSKDAMGIGFPFINLQNIFGKNIVDVSQLGLAKASSIQLKNYNLQKGDVLFVRSSVKLEGVGEAAIVPKNLENTTYSGFIIRYRDSFGLDYNFKRFTFGTSNIRNQIMSQATDSANKNISQQVLAELDILVPSLPEQSAIGTFFSTLDRHITLHQRKLEKLKNLKKALLNELFV